MPLPEDEMGLRYEDTDLPEMAVNAYRDAVRAKAELVKEVCIVPSIHASPKL